MPEGWFSYPDIDDHDVLRSRIDEVAERVGEALARLDAEDRELLTLIAWEDLTSEQAARS